MSFSKKSFSSSPGICPFSKRFSISHILEPKAEILENEEDLSTAPKCPFGSGVFQKYFKVNDCKTTTTKTAEHHVDKRKSMFTSPGNGINLNVANNNGLKHEHDDKKKLQGMEKKKILKNDETVVSLIGVEKLTKILQIFFQRIFKHPEFKNYYKEKNMEKMNETLPAFFIKHLSLINSPVEFNSVSLKASHSDLKITNAKFDVFKGILAITFRENHISEELLCEIFNFVEKLRKHIITPDRLPMELALSSISSGEAGLFEFYYKKLLDNSIIAILFKDWTVQRHQSHFHSILEFLGKDISINCFKIRENHKNLWLNPDLLYYYKQIFCDSLRKFKVDDELIFKISDKFNTADLLLQNEETHFYKLLENNSLDTMANAFYSQMQKSRILSKLFENKDAGKVKHHCENMILFCLQGPSKYKPCDITPAHIKVKITQEHYFEMRKVFKKTLKQLNISKNQIVYILADLDYYQYDISNNKCLLEKIGGEKNIEYLVRNFYTTAFEHEKLSGFYRNTNIDLMIKNQTFFFKKFFSAKEINSNYYKSLRTFHLNIDLREEDFDFFCKTMANLAGDLVDEKDVKDDLVRILLRTKRDILNLQD